MFVPPQFNSRFRRALAAATIFLAGLPAAAFAGNADDLSAPGMAPAGVSAPGSANDVLPAVAIGTAFTYQGQLLDNGSPASGQYDLQFSLFDAASDGTQIGFTATINDIVVADGRFTAEIDFGPMAFGSGARWLAISVRPGASGGGYTLLSPRQKINGAPFAQALPLVYPMESIGFVGIGRTFKISSAEAFGVNASTGPNGYGGMYINTTDATGWPFYGFATGGQARAWTYFDGLSTEWHLYNGGNRLSVPSTGGLHVENVTSGDGIVVNQTTDDGIQIGSGGFFPNYGIYIPSPGVAYYGLWPNTANASGQWGLYTSDNISAGNVFASAQTLVAKVSGPDVLNPGDVVAAVGVTDPVPGGTERLVLVQLAGGNAGGIVGVVATRMVFDFAAGKETDSEKSLHSADGPARNGDYVAMVVLGVADVKVDRSASITRGERVTAAATDGRVRPLRNAMLGDMQVTEGAQVVGIALAASSPGADTVPVFVTLK